MKIVNQEGFTVTPWRDHRLDGWAKRMSKDRLDPLFDDKVAAVLMNQGFNCPNDPRSIYRPAKLYEALNKYGPANAPQTLDGDDLKAGYALARICFSRPAEKEFLDPLPLNTESARLMTSNPKGSAGLTLVGRQKCEAVEEAVQRAKLILSREKAPEPCIAFARTQFNDKTRLVWGYPYSMTVLEGMLARPLINEFKKGQTPLVMATPTGVLGARLRVSSYNKAFAYSLDMSSYDASLSAKLIKLAFLIIGTWFDPNQVVADGWTTRDLLDRIQHYFIHTPIVMPDRNVYRGKAHGVPSGSYFTNMIDSIANVIIVGAIGNHFSLDVKRKHLFVCGDDILFWSKKRVSLEEISKYAKVNLGVNIHGPEKSSIYEWRQPIHFLGRDWTNGVPNLALEDIIKRMVNPESYREYSDDVAKRTRQIKLMILSYAAVYRTGWMIAQHALGDGQSYDKSSERIEAYVYGRKIEEDEKSDIARGLTGLVRFRIKYSDFYGDDLMTTTGMQFWL